MSKGFASTPRIAVLAGALLLAYGGLGMRLVWLHVMDRPELLQYVEKARRQIIVQSGRRGDILDARGALLATSRSVIVLGVDPQAVRPEDRKQWPRLAAILGLPESRVEEILTTKYRPAEGIGAAVPAGDDTQLDEPDERGNRPIRWARLGDGISESDYAEILKLGIRGVYGDRVYRRDYPHHELAAHLIGYVDRQGQPVTGIERYADFYLRGEDGWVESEKDGRRQELAQFRTREVPPADGYNVVLSIDAAIQHIAEAELQEIAKKYEPKKATVIISDPHSGFILALANYPTFDLNEYNRLPPTELGRMRDVAVADMYEPGSVFKIVAISGALEDGLVTPETTFDCNLDKIDYLGLVRRLPDDDEHFDHRLTVAEVIAHSSNRGAAQMGMMLGAQRFYAYARAYGFGQPTGFPIGDESPGFLLPPSRWDGLTITRMPAGYAVDVTVMQMNQAMEVIASGGMLLRPQIIREIRDDSGQLVYRFNRSEVRRVISARTAAVMARLLTGVASPDGTAPEAAIPGYEVAGKTGTVRKIIGHQYSNRHHVASFIGFFPASRPEVVVSVVVDDADARVPGGVAYGSKVAAPAFRHIAEQLIPYLDIMPPLAAPAGPGLAVQEGGRM